MYSQFMMYGQRNIKLHKRL